MRVDFLILYENKNREKEGIYLLKAELERRGYSVKVEPIHYRESTVECEVLILPFLYDDNDVYDHIYTHNGKMRKVLSLRWEQVLNRREENDHNIYFYPKGEAKKAIQICWGENEANLLERIGVEKTKIKITGPIHLDCSTEPRMFDSKEKIAERYLLNSDATWLLFISSFSYTTLSESEEKKLTDRLGESAIYFKNVSIKSKSVVLGWLEKIAIKYPEIEVLYRLHPSERDDPIVRSLENEHKNFHTIVDESVDQWIFVSEKIYNWYSTSAVSSYIMGKGNKLLRPYEFEESEDINIFTNANILKTYEEFEKSLSYKVEDIKDKFFDEYYIVDGKSYFRVADVCQELFEDKSAECGIDYDLVLSGISRRWKIRSKLYPIYEKLMRKVYSMGIEKYFVILGARRQGYELALRNRLSNDEIRKVEDRVTCYLSGK